MSYSMHSPPPPPAPSQGYNNTEAIYNSRTTYTNHLMGPNTMNNYYHREDLYGNSASGASIAGIQQYANGLQNSIGVAGSNYTGSALHSSIPHHTQIPPPHPHPHHHHHHSPHTYPHVSGGSMVNHHGFGQHPQQDYLNNNSCIGLTRPANHHSQYNTSSNVSSSSRGHSTSTTSSIINSKSYWACDPTAMSQQQPSNHQQQCYANPNASINSSHHKQAVPPSLPPPPNSNQTWSRSPNVISSPSTTPSPTIQPCPSTTPHPTPTSGLVGGYHGSSPSSHHETNKQQPFNGQIIPSHNSSSGHTSVSSTNNLNNCNSNPLQSLQKMVQIDSDGGGAYDNSTTVPIVNQHLNNHQQPPPSHPHSSSIMDNDASYPTYYNMDQNRMCATPHSQPTYPPATNLNAQQQHQSTTASNNSGGVVGAPFSPSTAIKNSHSPEEQTRNNQTIATKDSTKDSPGDINSLTRANLIRFPASNNNKIASKNGATPGSCSTDTCSNESPSAQSVGKVSTLPESLIHADQTHDSMNSFRGSETTANSRDSIKSSDSDGLSSYAASSSQCPTPNNVSCSWKSPSANQSVNEFRRNSNNLPPSKSWWQENSSSNNRSFTPQTITSNSDCNQYGSYSSIARMSSTSSMSNQQHQSSWSPQVSMSNHQNSSILGASPGYGSTPTPEGIVKKKRGRPFGSKNRRSLEAAAANQIIDPNKRIKQRKSTLIDIGINTNLSFDVQESWNRDDSVTFSNEPINDNNNAESKSANSVSNTDSTAHHRLPLASRRKKIVGPVVRIDKYETNHLKYSVVNNSSKIIYDVDERGSGIKTGKTNNRRKNHHQHISKKSFFNSNINQNTSYNNLNIKNWVCILCQKGPHYKGLGILYGPYFISLDPDSKIILFNLDAELFNNNNNNYNNNNDHETRIEDVSEISEAPITTTTTTTERRSLRKRSETNKDDKDDTSKANRNNSATSNHHYQHESTKMVTTNNNGNRSTTELEVWVHEDCIVWSNNVYLEGTRIRNLEPAIIESFQNICTSCKLPGATLGCIYKNCNVSPLHYLCAKEKDCDLDEEKFILSCSKHKKRRLMLKDNFDSNNSNEMPKSEVTSNNNNNHDVQNDDNYEGDEDGNNNNKDDDDDDDDGDDDDDDEDDDDDDDEEDDEEEGEMDQ